MQCQSPETCVPLVGRRGLRGKAVAGGDWRPSRLGGGRGLRRQPASRPAGDRDLHVAAEAAPGGRHVAARARLRLPVGCLHCVQCDWGWIFLFVIYFLFFYCFFVFGLIYFLVFFVWGWMLIVLNAKHRGRTLPANEGGGRDQRRGFRI